MKNALIPRPPKIPSTKQHTELAKVLYAAGVSAGMNIERELEHIDVHAERTDATLRKLASSVADLRLKVTWLESRLASQAERIATAEGRHEQDRRTRAHLLTRVVRIEEALAKPISDEETP